MLHTTTPLLRRASMAWKPVAFSQTRRRNARKRRTLQLMVDAQLTKKYTNTSRNVTYSAESFDATKEIDAVMQRIKQLQPVHVGTRKLAKREIVDQWFKVQGARSEI